MSSKEPEYYVSALSGLFLGSGFTAHDCLHRPPQKKSHLSIIGLLIMRVMKAHDE